MNCQPENPAEAITKKGHTIKVSYNIQLQPDDLGFIVNQTDIQVLEFDNEVITDQGSVSAIVVSVIMPSIKVDQYGKPIEIIDFDEYLVKLASTVNDPRYTQALQSEQMQSLLRIIYWH